jgi:N-acetylneuraminic acid mutarotase
MRTPLLSVAVLLIGNACGGEDGGPPPDAAISDAPPIGADASSPGSWSAAPSLPSGPRQETGVAALDGRVYVIGGFDISQTVVATVEAYDPMATAWSTPAPLSAPMHHANTATLNDRIYVLGSLRGATFGANGEVWEYDAAGNAWTQRASMPSGTERGGSGVAVVGQAIYVVGGFRNLQAVSDFSAYHPDTDTWEPLPDLPTPRDHLVAGAVGNHLCAIGGRGGTISTHTARVDCFDVTAGTWAQAADMPTSRGGAAAAVLGGRIYVFGGEGNDAVPSGVFDVVESFDPVDNSWLSHTPMLTPRHGTGAAAVGNLIYVPGGADMRSFAAVATVEVFAP